MGEKLEYGFREKWPCRYHSYDMYILVVSIHTNLGKENEWTWILFQTITRIAVPYFLVVTGCLFVEIH